MSNENTLLKEYSNNIIERYIYIDDSKMKDVDKDAFVTNFERVAYNNQITDLYLFMRKCMEKQNWNSELGIHMLNEYNKVKSMTPEEKRVLYILFLYPEKFWKIVNHYYNGNKSWISQKSIAKLQNLVELETKRQNFLYELQRL